MSNFVKFLRPSNKSAAGGVCPENPKIIEKWSENEAYTPAQCSADMQKAEYYDELAAHRSERS